MKLRLLVPILLLVLTFAACRSRKTPTPRTEPAMPSVTESMPSQPIQAPETEFPAPGTEREDVLSEDIVEADRTARERGWIRDAFFAFDASTLDADAQSALSQTARWLRDHPEFRIRVEGHCDERGTEQYNLALGDRRAATAADYLVALGVARERITTVSYGEERPFESGSTEDAWAQNRRAHVVLVARR